MTATVGLHAFVRADDEVYSRSLDALTNALKQRKLLMLLGAGVSRDTPSSLPLAGTLVARLVQELGRAMHLTARLVEAAPGNLERPERVLKAARLERLLAALHRTHPAPPQHRSTGGPHRGPDAGDGDGMGAPQRTERFTVALTTPSCRMILAKVLVVIYRAFFHVACLLITLRRL